MSRVRKAVAAMAAAFISGLVTALINGDQPSTSEGWVGLIAGCLGLGLAGFAATYAVRNTGSDIGPNGSTIH